MAPSRTRRPRAPCPSATLFELALVRRAIEREIPFLGICRGMQVMNVAAGGTLNQHLPDDVGHEDHRRSLGSFDNSDHDVRLAHDSLAARAAREELHGTKSHHHQGVERIGKGLEVDRLGDGRRPARGDRGARATASRSASSGTPRPTRTHR
jgi:gamma-glutamyl-gamma-aminobutyrate hydrolase PuuD